MNETETRETMTKQDRDLEDYGWAKLKGTLVLYEIVGLGKKAEANLYPVDPNDRELFKRMHHFREETYAEWKERVGKNNE